ncbi:MAG: 23S rRNA (pseudouridine(1915)-N(3))-methyltransferase RlmH, partial [Anaeroplasmataceae bacterium]|nr:23S rRNA (pseudouridine(1915)-N(3))-methyltransferase RlmH [Anaeroplasmataceae bacterium]
MKITILSVGNIKEKYLVDAIKEYTKRLSKYSKIEFLKVNDEAIGDNPSDKEMEQVKDKEAQKLLKLLPKDGYKIALNLKGEML